MYVIALCGPIGANLKLLAEQISTKIQEGSKENVVIIPESKFITTDGGYKVVELIQQIEQEQGVMVLFGHHFFKDNALQKALNPASKEKEAQQTNQNLHLKLFLETDEDTCRQRYLLERWSTEKEKFIECNKEYGELIKPVNEKINSSYKQADVRVHDGANHDVICTLILSRVNAMPNEKQELGVSSTPFSFFS